MRSLVLRTSVGAAAVAMALALPVASIGTSSAGAATAVTASVHAVPWPVVGPHTPSPAAQVRTVQYLLAAHGLGLAATGAYDAHTMAAVRTFQRAEGLAPTGVVAAPTWVRLIVWCTYGEVGSAVRALQNQLNYYNLKGSALLAVDGIYGPHTHQAVLDFQRSRGLVVDGIVGPVTWRYLVSLFMGG